MDTSLPAKAQRRREPGPALPQNAGELCLSDIFTLGIYGEKNFLKIQYVALLA